MIRVSLRELFLLVAATALAIMSLVTASFAWQAIVGLLVMLLALTAVIVSLVDRGRRQAFAIGFSVAMLGYGALVVTGREDRGHPNIELVASEGRLPTTVSLYYLHSFSKRAIYIDAQTHARVTHAEAIKADDEFNKKVEAGKIGGAPAVYRRFLPPEKEFTTMGQYWWAMFLGYCGGQLARTVYLKRMREQSVPSQAT